MWTVEFSRKAEKAIDAMHPQTRQWISGAIDVLLIDPYKAKHIKPLKGSGDLRLRVGEFRVVYRLEKNRLIVVVIDIGPRSGIYD